MTRRGRAGAAAGAVLALTAVTTAVLGTGAGPAHAAAPPAPPAPPTLELVGDPPGTVHLLTPGETSRWYLGETSRAVQVQQLTAALAASGDVTALHAAVVGLRACTAVWRGERCPGAEHLVLPPTTVGALAHTAASVTESGAVAAQNFLLVSVLLPHDAPPSTGGATVRLRLDLSALGVVAPSGGASGGTGARGPELPGLLARTGTRLSGVGVLAGAAVGVGILFAALARRRRRADDTDDEARA